MARVKFEKTEEEIQYDEVVRKMSNMFDNALIELKGEKNTVEDVGKKGEIEKFESAIRKLKRHTNTYFQNLSDNDLLTLDDNRIKFIVALVAKFKKRSRALPLEIKGLHGEPDYTQIGWPVSEDARPVHFEKWLGFIRGMVREVEIDETSCTGWLGREIDKFKHLDSDSNNEQKQSTKAHRARSKGSRKSSLRIVEVHEQLRPIFKAIDELRAYGNAVREKSMDRAETIESLGLDMKSRVEHFAPDGEKFTQEELDAFKTKFIASLHYHDKSISRHRTEWKNSEWKMLVANILMLITGLCIVKCMVTGYGFFDKTNTQIYIDNIEEKANIALKSP